MNKKMAEAIEAANDGDIIYLDNIEFKELQEEEIRYIPQAEYDRIIELLPIICVDVAIEHQDKILLIKRRDEPEAGQWWLPGGRLYKSESLEACALRKAKEEVGLDCKPGPMVYHKSIVFEKVHSVNFVYLLFAPNNHFRLDASCLDYKWVSSQDELEHFHRYIANALRQAMWWSLE